MAIYTGTTTSKGGRGTTVWFAIAAVIVGAILIFALMAIGHAGGGSGPNTPPQGQSGNKVQLSHGAGSGASSRRDRGRAGGDPRGRIAFTVVARGSAAL